MELIDTARAVHLYRPRHGRRDERRVGGEHDVRRRQPRRQAAYIGKVSDDDLGNVFGHDMNALGVSFRRGAPG